MSAQSWPRAVARREEATRAEEHMSELEAHHSDSAKTSSAPARESLRDEPEREPSVAKTGAFGCFGTLSTARFGLCARCGLLAEARRIRARFDRSGDPQAVDGSDSCLKGACLIRARQS